MPEEYILRATFLASCTTFLVWITYLVITDRLKAKAPLHQDAQISAGTRAILNLVLREGSIRGDFEHAGLLDAIQQGFLILHDSGAYGSDDADYYTLSDRGRSVLGLSKSRTAAQKHVS